MTNLMPMLSLSVSGAAVAVALATTFALVVVLASILGMRRRRQARLQGAVASTASEVRAAQSPKIVIFYSSIGYGHISAAQAIQDEIGRQYPAAHVLLQDIRAFMHPLWRRIDERLYWFVANSLPECFEYLFRSTQARGNCVPSLALLPSDYPEEKVLAYLAAQAPDAVIATHYGAAQVLGTLRQRELLPNMRIGWLHTDFFEGYLPRISMCIDRTFLAHEELESLWLAAGVPPDRVVASGMPVRIPATEPEGRQIALARLGLAPGTPTLLLTAGKEGAADYTAVVEGIARHCQGRVQIIAACGTNTRQQASLADLQEHLPPRVALKVLGLLPQHEMASYMRAADLLITKAGGITPSEAFAMGTPTLLLDIVSGHERENAALFVRLGLAELVAHPDQAGKLAADILSDPRRREGMLCAQHEFREGANIALIAQFALDDSFTPACPPPDFGVENGTPALDIDEALARLDAEAPAEVELLLSYATSQSLQRIVLENPFGHLAIRVNDTVYSANYLADRSIDPNLLQHMSLAEYLYGVQRPACSQVHTNTYGMAYGRDTLAIRVAGIQEGCTTAMVAEAHRIEDGFRDGTLRWDRSDFNCAHVVARMLQVGGYGDHSLFDRLALPAMPLDLFERARALFEEDASLKVDLGAYRQVPGSRASYRFSRFPLSLGQPLRSAAQVLSDTPRDPLEAAVTRQVTAYLGDRRLYVEDLRMRGSTSERDDPLLLDRLHPSLEKALVVDLRRLLAVYASLPVKKIERLNDRYTACVLRPLIDHGLELARLATERAEEILLYPQARRLRTLFTQLVSDYGRIRARRWQARQVEAYMGRLWAFESAVRREFSRLGAVRTGRVWATWLALPGRGMKRLSRLNRAGILRAASVPRRIGARRVRTSRRNGVG
ncbi:MAG: glycosyltransferase [Thermoanaerobaculia bacterium]